MLVRAVSEDTDGNDILGCYDESKIPQFFDIETGSLTKTDIPPTMDYLERNVARPQPGRNLK